MPLEPSHGSSLSSRLLTNKLPNAPGASAARRAATLLLLGFGLFGFDEALPAQEPAPQPPAQTQLPPPTAPTPQQTPAPTAAPPQIAPDDPDNGEPLSLYIWKTSGPANLRPGTQAAVPNNQLLALPNFSSLSPAGVASIPAGKFNHLEVSYFQADGNGTTTTPIALSLFGSNFGPGTLMSNSYRVRNAQLTWNYLTWPSPPEDSKFRFRTLYGFNYTRVSAVLDAPLDLSTTFMPGHGFRQLFYPVFGVDAEYIPSKHLVLEARTWGFGFPQHADVGISKAPLSCASATSRFLAATSFFISRRRRIRTNISWAPSAAPSAACAGSSARRYP